jgi:hypothetical protein
VTPYLGKGVRVSSLKLAVLLSALVAVQLLGQVERASAQGWSGVLTDVSGYATEHVSRPEVAVDGAGNAIAAWSLVVPPSLLVARYTAGAAAWSEPVNVAPGIAFGWPDVPRVAMDASGNALLVWRERSGVGRIRAVRYLVATGMWTAPVTISDSAMGYVHSAEPHLAVDPAGNALVVWALTIPRAGFSDCVVQGVRFTAASATWSSPVALGAIMRAECRTDDAIAVAADRFGNGVAVWRQTTGAAYPFNTPQQGARYRAASGWGPPVDLTAPGLSAFQPNVVVDQSGNATVIWADFLQTLGPVRAVRYTAASDGWSNPFELTATANSTTHPQLVVDAAGNVTAIWEESGVRARRYAAASGAWQETRPVVSDGPGEAYYRRESQGSVDGQGVVTAVWSNRSLIESARYTPSTDAWSSPVSLTRLNALGYRASSVPRLGADTAGNVVVVWRQTHGADFTSVVQSTRWQVSGAVNNTVPSGLLAALINTQVTLRWVAPLALVTSYVIEAGSSPGAVDLAQFDIGSTSPFLQVRAPLGVYYVRVRAIVDGVLSLPSNEIRLTVGSPCSMPAAPANLTNTTTSTSVSLSWQTGTGATSYTLEAGSSPGLSDIVVVNTGSTATTFSAAAPPGVYFVRIRSRNACGSSGPSNETTVTIAAAPAPGAPTLNTPVVSGNTVMLSWSAGSGSAPTGYTLTASVTPGGAPIATVSLSGASASFPGVPSGTYYLRLTASNAAGMSPPSAQVTLNVP